MQAEVSDELDRFGANIIVTPKSRALDLGYGGLAVGGVTVDAEELRMADIPAIRTIPNKRNISAVAPKLVGTLDVEGQRMVLIGADLREERRVKSWWKVDGRFAASPPEAMLGAEAAQMLHKRVRAMLQFTRFGYAVSVVVLLVGIMVVMSTMMSSVTERTAEIGILRAVGFRQSQVARMLLVETIAISAAGGLAGWILGTVAVRFAGPAMAQLANPVAPPWTLATPAVLLAVLVGTIGGIYPALRAARMDPARALRYL